MAIPNIRIQTRNINIEDTISNAFKVYSFVTEVMECGVDFS